LLVLIVVPVEHESTSRLGINLYKYILIYQIVKTQFEFFRATPG
jgi:hypothetical protein